MADLEEKLLEIFEKKNNDLVEVHRWHNFICKHSGESLRDLTDQVNLFHSTIKFTAEYSKEVITRKSYASKY